MRSLGRLLYLLVVLALTLLLGWRTVDDLRFDPARYGVDQVGPDVREQLTALGRALRSGEGRAAADRVRGGELLAWAFYGLANVELGLRYAPGSPPREQAANEARAALAALEDPALLADFPSEREPPHGMQYQGFVQWLRGGILLLARPDDRDPETVRDFRAGCGRMAAAWRQSRSPLLPSADGRDLPLDNVVGLAALRLHDQLFPPRYGPLIDAWLQAAREHLDPQTGLLPHDRDEGPRGLNSALALRFLAELDPAFAQAGLVAFREHFLDRLVVLPAVREYPKGAQGPRDADSGPLLGPVSVVATALTIGSAQVLGDAPLAGALLRATELIGLPFGLDGGKRYGMGALLVLDAALAWSKTARAWTRPIPTRYYEPIFPGWRLWWYGVVLAVLLLAWFPVLDRLRGAS
ncbi:MAG: hypothetical protein H6704_26800 [Myxococcales bacterium]|nr:hypothetical protein [Myxococcales bacterium]